MAGEQRGYGAVTDAQRRKAAEAFAEPSHVAWTEYAHELKRDHSSPATQTPFQAFTAGYQRGLAAMRDTRQDVIDALQDQLRLAVIQRDQVEQIAANALKRNNDLEAALREYGRHRAWCAGCNPAKQDDFCTCGLAAALAYGDKRDG